MSSLFQVRLKCIGQRRVIHHHNFNILRLTLSHHYFCTKTTNNNDSNKKDKKFEFVQDFDDFESFQKRQNMKDSSNYYHEYFTNNKANNGEEEEEILFERRKLKKRKGSRKTDREKTEESETSRLKIEYRIIGGVILFFTSLVGYYFYYISGSKIGKADTYYKTAMDYELQCNASNASNAISETELIKKTDYYYKKALEYTDYSYPKYLYKYSQFLLYKKQDYMASEHYITKAIGLHQTNAVYHKFYCILLKYAIEKKGNIDRLNDYNLQKIHTINAHINEAKYFLNEENNEKAAIMHFDYALNFCDESIQKSNENDAKNKAENVMKIKENVEEMKRYKIKTYEDAANLLQEYGFTQSAQKYWQDGIHEFGEPVRILYGVFLYQQQKFDEAMQIFNLYCESIANENNNYNMTAIVFKARLLMEMGQYKNALDIYNAILPQIGNHLDPMIIGDLIYILIEMNKINEANSLMKQVIILMKNESNDSDDLSSNEQYNYLNMIFILLKGKLNEIEMANYQCLEMVNKYPSDFEVNYFAALYYHRYGQNYDKADRYYRNAISIEEQWAKVYYNYSLLFLQNNDKAQFLKYIKIAYQKNKTIPHIQNLYQKYFDDEGRILTRVLT